MWGMLPEEEFEDIRPYNDDEINPALKRMIANPVFNKILEFIFPDQDGDKIKENLAETYSAHDFQVSFMHPLVYSIVRQDFKGFDI